MRVLETLAINNFVFQLSRIQNSALGLLLFAYLLLLLLFLFVLLLAIYLLSHIINHVLCHDYEWLNLTSQENIDY